MQGRLPAAAAPFPDGTPDPQSHLRKVGNSLDNFL
jgi:hypothetical protein